MKRCAVYSRVSTAMQAEVEYNSCEAQKDRIHSYIKSQEDLEVYREYSDAGFSAATLNRPAFKELLGDIAKRKIDVVLTYKIDRLTRSSKDFYNLIEYFEKYGVSFVSVSERFDTSSAAGRLLRNIMLTFAQFEREMTSERIRDKFEQKAKKGLWNGAIPPFGYKTVYKKLVIDKPRAAVVRSLFEEFITSGSYVHAVKYVKSQNILNPRTNLPLSVSTLGHILRNPVYSGKVIWRKKAPPGNHEPIVLKELFELAQELTREKVIKKRLYKKFLLGGLVKCSACGSTMTNAYTNKKTTRYYYYKCTKVVKEGKNACTVKAVSAERLERFVSDYLNRIADDRQYIESLVFRLMHQQPRQIGFEPTDKCLAEASDRIQQVLFNFKEGSQKGSQIERCLIFQKTIQEINFSRETLEVVVSLTDGQVGLAGKADLRRARRSAARIREGEHGAQTHTETDSSNKKLAERVGFEPTRPLRV